MLVSLCGDTYITANFATANRTATARCATRPREPHMTVGEGERNGESGVFVGRSIVPSSAALWKGDLPETAE